MEEIFLTMKMPGSASDYGRIILCLLEFEIPRETIAKLFRTTVGNVGQIKKRELKKRKTAPKPLPKPPSLAEPLSTWKRKGEDWSTERELSEIGDPSRDNRRFPEFLRFQRLLDGERFMQQIEVEARRVSLAMDDPKKREMESFSPFFDYLSRFEKETGKDLETIMMHFVAHQAFAAQKRCSAKSLFIESEIFKQLVSKTQEPIDALYEVLENHDKEMISGIKSTAVRDRIIYWYRLHALRSERENPFKPVSVLLDDQAKLAKFKEFQMHSGSAGNEKTLLMQMLANISVAGNELLVGDLTNAYKNAIRAMKSACTAFDKSYGSDEFLCHYLINGAVAMKAALMLRRPEEGLSVCRELELALPYCEIFDGRAIYVIKAQLLMQCGRDDVALNVLIKAKQSYREEQTMLVFPTVVAHLDPLINILEGKVEKAFKRMYTAFLYIREDFSGYCNAFFDAYDTAFGTDSESGHRIITKLLVGWCHSHPDDPKLIRQLFVRIIIPQLQLNRAQRIRLIRQF